MARPNGIQKLKHGKFLTKANFPKFVETWNWLVTAFDAMTGDKQTNPHEGRIVLDRTNPDRPVIRCEGCKKAEAASSGCNFSYDAENHTIRAGIFFSGRTTVEVDALDIGEEYTGKAYLAVDMTNQSGELVAGDWNPTPTNTQMHVPLYEFEEGAIIADYRGAPTVQRWE